MKLAPISFISPETKDYLNKENKELQKILDKLLKEKIITDSQHTISSQELKKWSPLSPAYSAKTKQEQQEILTNLSSTIGDTQSTQQDLWNGNILIIKDESENLFWSHYDRVLLWILPKIIEKKVLSKVIEISSWSLGISLAWICSYLMGQTCYIITAENDFPIRYSLAQRLWANIILSDKSQGISGSGKLYSDNIRNFIRDGITPLNHSHSHWDEISSQIQKIWTEISQKIDYFMAIKWNGTAALGIAQWLTPSNSNVKVYWVRNTWKKWWALQLPGNDYTDINFPRLKQFEEKYEEWEITLNLTHITERSSKEELWMSSAAWRLAVEKFISENSIQNKVFLIINHDSPLRY